MFNVGVTFLEPHQYKNLNGEICEEGFNSLQLLFDCLQL